MPPHFSHHAPFSPNPHGPMVQPLPPLLALAPHHSQPPQCCRDATPVDSPFMAKRDGECMPDVRDTGSEHECEQDCRACQVHLRESRDTTSKMKRGQERSHHPKHFSLYKRQPATSLMLPLHPSHAQVVQCTPIPTSSQLQQQIIPHTHGRGITVGMVI